VDVCIDSPQQAAKIIMAARRLGAKHGILITVPVPVHAELDAKEAEKAIIQATDEAEVQGIRGKDVTPFILARVTALTGDGSKRANVALLRNNAHIAAQIAQAIL